MRCRGGGRGRDHRVAEVVARTENGRDRANDQERRHDHSRPPEAAGGATPDRARNRRRRLAGKRRLTKDEIADLLAPVRFEHAPWIKPISGYAERPAD